MRLRLGCINHVCEVVTGTAIGAGGLAAGVVAELVAGALIASREGTDAAVVPVIFAFCFALMVCRAARVA